MVPVLDKSNLYCHYDQVKQLPIVIFRDTLTVELIEEAHQWLWGIFDAVKDERSLQGLIYDLQAVKQFKGTGINLVPQQSHPRVDIDRIPTAIIACNVFQEHQMRETLLQAGRSWLVNSYSEAFDFILTLNSTARGIDRLGLETNALILNSESASVFYDVAEHNLVVTYYGGVSPMVTADVYRTIGSILENCGVETVRGGIFDFRHVSHFENANLATVRRTSSDLNLNYDMSHIAVPLIVGTTMQERMVMMSVKVTPQEERKRIVYSTDEALNFIQEFHASLVSKIN